ncbi:MAG TPA: SDR family NAD(P)-dependent oxidoreductase [Spirochaetia bacterium]|nr:SDR family NAD(P)-dependent oxidoreductase [Spirochaetia bacterium]
MGLFAYVTGADRGLGLALVAELLRHSYQVFAGSFLSEHPELDRLAQENPGRVHVLRLDVTDQKSVDAAAAAIAKTTDRLNLLINNAGTAVDRSRTILDELHFDDMHTIIEVNAFGPLRVTKSVVPLLLKADPKVLINISSVAASLGTITRSTQYPYTMSKVSLNMQSKLIKNHFGNDGLVVLAVHPGAMPTLILGDPEITKNAPVKPEDSARGIVALAERTWSEGDPMFLDYQGKPIPW